MPSRSTLGGTFRHDMYEAYKGHRERTPDELAHAGRADQADRRARSTSPSSPARPFEADDILATLALQAEARGVDTLIVTGDRDILQVVDDHITVLTSGRFFSDTIYYTPESVKAKYGLEPSQLVDYKALIGDKSDNIPGVKGIGEKGATDLLQRYGTLEAVYADLDQVTPNRLQTRAQGRAGRRGAEPQAGQDHHRCADPARPGGLPHAALRPAEGRGPVPGARVPLACECAAPRGAPTAAEAATAPLRQPAGGPAEGGRADGPASSRTACPRASARRARPSLPAQAGPTPILVLQRADPDRGRRAAGRRQADRVRHGDHRHRPVRGRARRPRRRLGLGAGSGCLHPARALRHHVPALGNGASRAAAGVREPRHRKGRAQRVLRHRHPRPLRLAGRGPAGRHDDRGLADRSGPPRPRA